MPTHYFHSDMAGAPSNTSLAGSTLAILEAILETGFNVKAVISASVTGGVMTLTYAAPHGYENGVLLRLDGATGGSIVRRVTSAAGASSLTIPAAGFPDGAVGGSLSTRVAPADWEEVFSGPSKAVFRSKVEGPGSRRFFYQVTDATNGGSAAVMRGFETMTDVDTGTGPFPATPGGAASIARNPSASARPWAAVVDGRTCYISFGIADNSAQFYAFGDFEGFGSTDLFNAIVGVGLDQLVSTGTSFVSPRGAAGTGGAQSTSQVAPLGTSGMSSRPYPSPVDGGMLFARPILCFDGGSTTLPIRGIVRGLIHCSSRPIPLGANWVMFQAVEGIAGRVFVVRGGGTSACVAFPIDEDWA